MRSSAIALRRSTRFCFGTWDPHRSSVVTLAFLQPAWSIQIILSWLPILLVHEDAHANDADSYDEENAAEDDDHLP